MKSAFVTEYDAYCAEHGVPDRIELMLADINTILRCKWLPGDQADRLAQRVVWLPLPTYTPNIIR